MAKTFPSGLQLIAFTLIPSLAGVKSHAFVHDSLCKATSPTNHTIKRKRL